MSGITDPAEEYFKDGLWAWVTDQWKKLTGDAAGHLQVDVVASGLPTGAATSANQTTMITALQLIDDLRAALNSVGTDELDVVIDGQSADVEIKQTAAADLTPGVMGWDGSAWHKLPMVWGYSGGYGEVIYDAASGEGDAEATGSTVTSGEVWVIERVAILHTATTAKKIEADAYNNGFHIPLIIEASATALTWYFWSGRLTLPPGGNVFAWATAPGDGKTIYLRVWGYKMKVAE